MHGHNQAAQILLNKVLNLIHKNSNTTSSSLCRSANTAKQFRQINLKIPTISSNLRINRQLNLADRDLKSTGKATQHAEGAPSQITRLLKSTKPYQHAFQRWC